MKTARIGFSLLWNWNSDTTVAANRLARSHMVSVQEWPKPRFPSCIYSSMNNFVLHLVKYVEVKNLLYLGEKGIGHVNQHPYIIWENVNFPMIRSDGLFELGRVGSFFFEKWLRNLKTWDISFKLQNITMRSVYKSSLPQYRRIYYCVNIYFMFFCFPFSCVCACVCRRNNSVIQYISHDCSKHIFDYKTQQSGNTTMSFQFETSTEIRLSSLRSNIFQYELDSNQNPGPFRLFCHSGIHRT